ncbi:hypothetical protein K2X92_02215 [Candidatus Gracilibacteria bacterium]|nr:hypothetical protein [Candidatus Gracilibacteria bacterium]
MRKILFIIISLLMLTGIGIYYILNPQDTPWNIKYSVAPEDSSTNYEEMRAKIEETAQKNIDLYNTAIKESNAALCNGISIDSKKMECLDMTKINLAKKEGNIEACNNISSTGSTILCRDNINIDTAISKGDSKLCEVVVDMKRKEFCENSIVEMILKKHIEEKTVNREFCAGLGEKYQSICFKEIQSVNENDIYKEAILTSDINLCNKIQSIDLKDNCSDAIYLKIATSTENSLLCDNILNHDKSLYCKGQLSKNTDIALFKSAVNSNLIENCKDIKNTNLHNRCIDTIIFTTVKSEQNSALCGSLTNVGLFSSCEQLVQQ